jgi:hydroxyacylglutathione hydrolase
MTVLFEDAAVRISRLRLGPWETNAYVVVCLATNSSLVVDAPAEAPTIIGALKETSPKYVLLTHDHLDHVGALAELRNKLKVPFGCHPLDSSGLAAPPELALRGGEELSLGRLKVAVIHTPGHTRGSLCFRLGVHLVSGDTLFPGGPGNTRSSADFKEIVRSLKERIFPLPDTTTVYPGHGETTVLGNEKAQFAVFAAREHSLDLHGDVLWASS